MFATEEPNSVIKGKVVSSDGQPAAFVSVQIKNKNRGTYTNENGEFVFKKLQPGKYILQVTLVGHNEVEKEVELGDAETVAVVLNVEASGQELQEVIVSAGTNRFAKKESDYVARLPLKNIENPQVYNTVGKELIQEQGIVSFDDALKNAPGVNRLWSSTGRPNDGAGFFSMRGFSVQPSMINGIAGLTNGSIDPANIERIETIKGPSGTLFGSSLISFGGLMNIVTKKPYEKFGGELTYTAGGFGLSRVTADINAPLNDDKTALLRVNGAYHYEGSFQDAGFKRSMFLAPSFSYKASDRLSFLVNTEIYSSEATNTLMVFLNRTRPLKYHTPKELGMDFNRSFTSNDIVYKNPNLNLFGQINYKISSNWLSQTNVARSVRKSDGYYSYVMFLDANSAPDKLNDTTLSRFAYYQNSATTATDIQQNFIGDFKIGGLRNRVVIGLDYLNLQTNNNNSPFLLFDTLSSFRVNDPNYQRLSRGAVDAKIAAAATGFTKNTVGTSTYSAYISDVLNITDALSAMLSLRVDNFDNKGTINHLTGATTGKYKQTTISPKFGLVYQLIKDRVSIFGNYMNGFRNVAPATQPLPELEGTFKPQQANQYEAGVKMDMFNHKLNLTLSYYDILVDNMTRPASIEKDGISYNYTAQDGSQKSQGIEFDLVAMPFAGLNIIAGYGYNKSEMEKADKNVQGRRPVSAGPEHLGNLWVSYTTQGGKLQGFGGGFGVNYASENIVTNDLRTGTFILPSYTILNATIFYNAKSYRFAVKADNLLDKEYFGGWTTVEKQLPQRFSASIAVRF